jgi:hypothetical protein
MGRRSQPLTVDTGRPDSITTRRWHLNLPRAPPGHHRRCTVPAVLFALLLVAIWAVVAGLLMGDL